MIRKTIVTLCIAALAMPAFAADKTPYTLPTGAKTIPCAGTPFGKRLTLGLDHEVMVTRRSATDGLVSNRQFSGDGLAAQRGLDLDNTTPGFGFDTARVDLDGDGRQEQAIARIRPSGVVTVTMVRPASGNTSANEVIGTWTLNPLVLQPGRTSFAQGIRVAAGDLDGSTDGREELVVAIRYETGGSPNVIGHRVVALTGAPTGGGAIAQADNAPLGDWSENDAPNFPSSQLAMAVGDMLLEGRDQVVVLNVLGSGQYRYQVLQFADSGTPNSRFRRTSFTQVREGGGDGSARLTLHIADVGGSGAEELIVHDLATFSGQFGNIVQTVRYLPTVRRPDNSISSFSMAPTTGLRNVISSSDSLFAAGVGEIDRAPNQEIAVARTSTTPGTLRVDVYKVGFDTAGFPNSIGPAAGFPSATTTLVNDSPTQLDLAVGDGDRDGIGDIYVALRDRAASGTNPPNVVKVRRYGLARPPVVPGGGPTFPNPASFAQIGTGYDFPAAPSYDTSAIDIEVADWDRNSLLANIGSTCREVQEPMVRTLVRHPPFWSRLQAPVCCFDASIGQERSQGTGLETRYDTFTSHDISGYVGASVGGEILGIGAEVSAKVTAGYHYESAKGEVRTTEATESVTQRQTQLGGGGLLVIEENTFRCYEYDVVSNGQAVADSNVRSCELVRRNASGTELRTFTGTDPTFWDTEIAAAGGAGGTPSQWTPLNPEWSSLALFRRATPNAEIPAAQLGNATDGQYATSITTNAILRPYIEIDLGAVKDVTNIRVFPQRNSPAAVAALSGASLFLSEAPFSGTAPPTGPNVRAFAPDPNTDNGADRWNVWTRDRTAPFAPARARYVRLQHTAFATRTLAVSEIQVFGGVQNEPPTYPLTVCDPLAGDGQFLARVVDTTATPRVYRNVDMRGDLKWVGWPAANNDPNCVSAANTVRNFDIWSTIAIGGSANTSWDLGTSTFNAATDTRSISSSARVGAEVEVQAGAFVQAMAGGAYEWATGATEEESSTMFWGEGINYGGQVPGFDTTLPDFGSALVQACRYRPQPFGYVTSDRSNIGFEHKFTAVDYVVRDFNWNRISNPPPPQCFPGSGGGPGPQPDPVFANGFE